MKVHSAFTVDDIEFDDYEVFKDKGFPDHYLKVPGNSVLRWVEVSMSKWTTPIAIPDKVAVGFGTWFKTAKWVKADDEGPVGLGPKRIVVFQDKDEATLVWEVYFFERNAAELMPARRSAKGFSQAFPGVKTAHLDPQLSETIWDLSEEPASK